ncbi:MAG: phosphatase PAP2 family protein, partial [Fidelibacterota bacterium]
MVRRALSAALFLALVHLSGADGGLLQADSLLSAALEGNNDYPVWNVAMESLSLVTPVMEIGWALSRYYRDHTDNPRISEPGRAAVGSFIITQAVVLTLKYTIRRERPARTYQPRLWNTRITPSFPSGHAATSAAVATVAAACDP